MNRLPEQLVQIGEALAAKSGYLRNVIRSPTVTCQDCHGPVEGYQRCYPCKVYMESAHETADRVTSIVYAIEADGTRTDQTYSVMRGYKSEHPPVAHTDTMRALLAIALVGHTVCDIKLCGRSNYRWATVPSTKGGAGEHPLHQLVDWLGCTEPEIIVEPAPGLRLPRELRPENFLIGSPIPVDTHVALVDDSWVTGGRAQSISAALKIAGAESVSVLTVARVVNPTYRSNGDFVRENLHSGVFDYTICPWTGGECP